MHRVLHVLAGNLAAVEFANERTQFWIELLQTPFPRDTQSGEIPIEPCIVRAAFPSRLARRRRRRCKDPRTVDAVRDDPAFDLVRHAKMLIANASVPATAIIARRFQLVMRCTFSHPALQVEQHIPRLFVR